MAILKGVKNKLGKTIDVTKKIGQGTLERSKEAIRDYKPDQLKNKIRKHEERIEKIDSEIAGLSNKVQQLEEDKKIEHLEKELASKKLEKF